MFLFDKLRRVLTVLRRGGAYNSTPFNLENLRKAILQVGFVESIEFIRFPPPPLPDQPIVAGMCKIYSSHDGVYGQASFHANIYYLSGMDADVTRLVVCKELCQTFWAQDIGVQANTDKKLFSLIESLTSSDQLQHFANQLFASEQWAMIAAIECLIPFFIREQLIEKIETGIISNSEIASRFFVPEAWIKLMFQRPYHDTIESGIRNGS